MEPLRHQRSEGASGHDNRSLGTERPTRADRYGCGDRLEYRDFGFYTSAAQQDGLDGFGNPMPANLVGAVVRHQSDEHTSDHRNHGYEPVRKRRARRPHHCEAESMEVEEIGCKRDGAEQQYSQAGCPGSDDERDDGEQPYTTI